MELHQGTSLYEWNYYYFLECIILAYLTYITYTCYAPNCAGLSTVTYYIVFCQGWRKLSALSRADSGISYFLSPFSDMIINSYLFFYLNSMFHSSLCIGPLYIKLKFVDEIGFFWWYCDLVILTKCKICGINRIFHPNCNLQLF